MGPQKHLVRSYKHTCYKTYIFQYTYSCIIYICIKGTKANIYIYIYVNIFVNTTENLTIQIQSFVPSFFWQAAIDPQIDQQW